MASSSSPAGALPPRAIDRRSPMRRRLVAGAAILVMLLVGLAVLKAIDVALGAMAIVQHPLSPPGTKLVTYKTSEFDIAVPVNRYGFRGTETAIRPGQIAVLGDSFTYGWGLKENETWASRLRESLRATGRDTDVYNLGVPGTDTIRQLEFARTYVPLLKPAVVVLSLVAGDDVADAMERHVRAPPFAATSSVRQMIATLAETTFPNLLVTSFRAMRGTQDATRNWPQLAAGLIAERGMALDPEMTREAKAGNINPFLLNLASVFPARNATAYGDSVEASTARMALLDAADELQRLVAQYGGRLVVLSMPSAPFVDSIAMRDHRRLGFVIPDANLSTAAPDQFADSMCRRVRSDCILMLDDMRARARTEDVFFPLDGHINPAGAAFVADRLGKTLGAPPS